MFQLKTGPILKFHLSFCRLVFFTTTVGVEFSFVSTLACKVKLIIYEIHQRKGKPMLQ